jgi:hypothetical protein
MEYFIMNDVANINNDTVSLTDFAVKIANLPEESNLTKLSIRIEAYISKMKDPDTSNNFEIVSIHFGMKKFTRTEHLIKMEKLARRWKR